MQRKDSAKSLDGGARAENSPLYHRRLPRRWGVALVGGMLAAGCSIHPLPEDSTQLTTYQISRQIDCETREAVIASIIGFLTNEANQTEFIDPRTGRKFVRVDKHSYAVGLDYKEGRASILNFNPKQLTGNANYIVNLIWKTGVAYNYNLEMTEINNNGGSINVLNALPTSQKLFGISAKVDLQRQNTRVFTTATNFGELVTGPRAFVCTSDHIVGPNYLYPIAGEIGIKKVIQDFTQLSIFGNLSGDLTKDFAKASGPAQLAEQLEFSTTLDLSVTPKVTFAPVPLVGAGLHLADASYTGQAQRKDLHKLTLGLFVPIANDLLLSRNGVLESLVAGPNARIFSAPVAARSSEAGALQVMNELLTLKLFQVKTQIVVQ